MSLVVHISVNESIPLETLAIRRTSNREGVEPQPDDINAYEVRRFDTRGFGLRQMGDTTEVLHRYGDPAGVLVYKALGAALAEVGL